MKKAKRIINSVIFGEGTLASTIFNIFIITCIILSSVAVIIELFYSGNKNIKSILLIIDWAFTAIFSIEYLLRIFSSQKKLNYIKSGLGIIDLVSILPTYIAFITPLAGIIVLTRMLRLARLLRLLRVLKLLRYLDTSMRQHIRFTIKTAAAESKEFFRMLQREQLFRLVFIVIVGVLILSTAVWIIERQYFKEQVRNYKREHEIWEFEKSEYEINLQKYNERIKRWSSHNELPEEEGTPLPSKPIEPTEPEEPTTGMYNFMDVLWWGFVTITTVGYGDRTTSSLAGRAIAVIVMFFGIIIVSILTGTIASILVDLKIKESQGLKELRLKGHIVILGWNAQSERILENLPRSFPDDVKSIDVVLLNNNDVNFVNDLKSRFESSKLAISFVKGLSTNVEVLKRANIEEARSAIILSDTSATGSMENADEKTIIVAAAIKDIAPKVKIVAQLMKPENVTHLQRSGVEDVIIDSDFGGYLLSQAPFSPGIPMLAREILTHSGSCSLKTERFPSLYIGEKFSAASEYFMNQNKILLGILKVVKEVSLGDIASGGMGLDVLIREKFGGMEKEYFGDGESIEVIVNPGYEYILEEEDLAFVISKETERK